MCNFDLMKQLWAFVLLLSLSLLSAQAQTIIDLEQGGKVRAKTIDDYKQEAKMAERLAADSVKYVDCLRRAFNALHTDSLAVAEELFMQALKLRPDAPGNPVVRHNLGLIHMARGNYRAAVNVFTDILKLVPEDIGVRMDRATAYLELGNATEAKKDCKALLALPLSNEEQEKVLFIQAGASLRQRLYKEARMDLEKMLRLNPNNVSAALLVAYTYEQDGQPQEALNRYSTLISAHPKNTEALLMRAALEEKQQMLEAARADYDAALQIEKNNPDIYVSRAALLIRLGLKEAARRDLREAIRLGYPKAALHTLFEQIS